MNFDLALALTSSKWVRQIKNRIRAPGKISSPGGRGLRILPPLEFLSVYETRKKAPPLGNFLRGADVRSRSLLLDFMYDTLHWKAYQEPKAVYLQGSTKLQSSWVEPIESHVARYAERIIIYLLSMLLSC